LRILSELGFRYDSSIFPVRHDLYGIPDHPRFPCQHGDASKWEIVECPISTWRAFGVNFPFGGGGYLRILPLIYTHHAFQRVNGDEQQPVIVYFHPWEIDPDQPRMKVPLRSRFRHYTNLNTMEGRIEALLRHYQFVPLCDLLKQDYPA
jgi:polysaccharide deacetylase family protein (PEP-CTERM system associated)